MNESKDPAVLLYTQDLLVGMEFMTWDQRGAYVTLLCLQHNHGHLPQEDIDSKIPAELWVKIKKKFIQDKEGNFYNSRMEKESLKRKNYVSSRILNRTKSKCYTIEHMSAHMEDIDENENKCIILIKDSIIKFLKYKLEIKKPFKTKSGFTKFIEHLKKLGNNNPETMKEILNQTIRHEWQGIFPLKDGGQNSGQSKQDGQIGSRPMPGKYAHLSRDTKTVS